MNRVYYIFISLVALLSFAEVNAQIIALGERTPRIKQAKWLDNKPPKLCDYVIIEFIHSESVSCRSTASQVLNLSKQYDNIAVVLISHQDATTIKSWVKSFVGEKSGVIIEDNDIRESYGVQYAPYAVMIDKKRRALWFGNPRLLDKATIEKILTNRE